MSITFSNRLGFMEQERDIQNIIEAIENRRVYNSICGQVPGMHRFLWDLRYTPPKALGHEYPISAIYKNTPREPRGPLVIPGQYTAKLTVGGKSYSQPLTVIMDPRIHDSLSLADTYFFSSAGHRCFLAPKKEAPA